MSGIIAPPHIPVPLLEFSPANALISASRERLEITPIPLQCPTLILVTGRVFCTPIWSNRRYTFAPLIK